MRREPCPFANECTVCEGRLPVPWDGDFNAKILILGECPGKEEDLEGRPFVGRSGKLLQEVLDKLEGGRQSLLIGNIVNCRAVEGSKNRNPSIREIVYCGSKVTKKYIESLPNLEFIIALGKSAVNGLKRLFRYFEDRSENLIIILDSGKRVQVRYLYHPSYILRRNTEQLKFRWMKELLDVLSARDLRDELDVTVIQDEVGKQELLEFADNWEGPVGFDVETNALPLKFKDCKVIGWGFSFGKKVFYATCDFSREELLRIFKKNRVIVFNAVFEGVLLFSKGINIYSDIELWDARALAISCNIYDGLKKAVISCLGVKDWSDELSEINTAILELVKRSGIVLRGKSLSDSDKFYLSVLDKYNLRHVVLEDLGKLREQYDKFKKKAFYEYVPLEIISKYCAVDCYSAVLLEEYLFKELKSEYNISNPFTEWPYTIYNAHFLLGASLTYQGLPLDKNYLANVLFLLDTFKVDIVSSFLENELVKANFSIKEDFNPRECRDYEELKAVFNINSNTASFREALISSILSDRVLALGAFYRMGVLGEFYRSPKLEVIFKELKDFSSEAKYTFIENFLLNYRDILKQDYSCWERAFIEARAYYELQSLEREEVKKLTSLFLDFIGEDPNNPTPEFDVLIKYKLAKKALKLESSYIKGKLGLQRLYLVNPPEYSRYVEHLAGKDVIELAQEIRPAMYDMQLFVCNAETRRWQAGVHTVPSKSIASAFRITRYSDSIYLKADHSQAELRGLAVFANEENMLDVFRQGKDIHRFVASQLFRKPEEEITSAERKKAKGGSFGIVYMMGDETLAQTWFGGDLDAAKDTKAKVFGAFPGIKTYMDTQVNTVKRYGKVKTLFGDYLVPAGELHQKQKAAVNWPIQNMASTLVGLTLYLYDKWLRDNGYKSTCTVFTHDAIEGELRPDEFRLAIPKLLEVSEEFPREKFNFPARLDIELGINGKDLVKTSDWVIKDGLVESFRVKGKIEVIEEVAKRLGCKFDIFDIETRKIDNLELILRDYGVYTPFLVEEYEVGKGVISFV